MIMFRELLDRLRKEVDMVTVRDRHNPIFILEFTSESGEAYSPLAVIGLDPDHFFRDSLKFHYMVNGRSKGGRPNPFVYENTWRIVAVKRPTFTKETFRIQIARR